MSSATSMEDQGRYGGASENWALRLRQKKKEVMAEEQAAQRQIKDYFSELTIRTQELQESTILATRNKTRDFMAEADYFLSLQESERTFHQSDIQDLIEFTVKFTPNTQIMNLLNANSFETKQDTSLNKPSVLEYPNCFQLQTTNKKNVSHLAMKQEYEDVISGLEQQIEALMIKDQKLRARIAQLESKGKTKKVGSYLFPVLDQEEANPSQLRLHRLQSENKILIEQISECSEKILSLRSDSSILLKQPAHSQLLTTEKKKPHESSQLQGHFIQFRQENKVLREQVEELKQMLDAQRQKANEQSSLRREREKVCLELEENIRELNDYNERLYSECDSNISKRNEMQEKLSAANEKIEQMSKEIAGLEEKLVDYKKLADLKEGRARQLEQTIQQYGRSLTQKEEEFRCVESQVERAQQISITSIKAKQLQIDSLKSIMKKDQSEISRLKEMVAQKEEAVVMLQEEAKETQSELARAMKEKDSCTKKEAAKLKKEQAKAQDELKKKMNNDFNEKYGGLLEKIESFSRDLKEVKDKYDSRIKIGEMRMATLKAKVTFQMKEMFEKGCKIANKDKIADAIKSYVESESLIALKNSTIKQMKEEIASLKKDKTKASKPTPATDAQVSNEIENVLRSVWQQKAELSRIMHEEQMNSVREMYELELSEKAQQLGDLKEKFQSQLKQLKELKQVAASCDSQTETKIKQWKAKLDKQIESEKKNESYIQSLKTNHAKSQQECQQLKQELRLKRQLILGLKKDLKDREAEKAKIDEALNGVMEENERLRKQIKGAVRKQAVYQNFKEKLQDQKQMESQLEHLKRQAQEQQKCLRAQINKKQSIIRELKANEELRSRKERSLEELDEEILDLRQKIRKCKSELERKDTLIQHLKAKSAKNESQLQEKQQSLGEEMRKAGRQLDAERSKLESCRSKLHLVESRAQILKVAIIKIYERLQEKEDQQLQYSTQYQTKATKHETTFGGSPKRPDLSKYREAFSILELSGEQFGLCSEMNPHMLTACSPIPKVVGEDKAMELADKLDGKDVDCKAIMDFFNEVIARH